MANLGFIGLGVMGGLTVDRFVAKGGRRSTVKRCVAAGLLKLQT